MDFSQFGAGWNESQDNMERKRVELAKAFEEFKSQNPYATAQDFQSFIDMASPNNYVRGGAPSADILESLGARNKIEKDKADFLAKIDKQSKIANLQNQIRPLFEGAMMDGNREGLDDRIAEAYKENKDLVDLVGGQGFLGQFNQSKFDQNMFERTSKALPVIKQMIVSSGGQIDKDAISRATGINVDLLDGIIDQADTALKRDNHQWFLTNRRGLTQDLVDWKKVNPTGNIDDFFVSMEGNNNGYPLSETDKNSLISLADGIESEAARVELENAKTAYNGIEDNIRADGEVDRFIMSEDKSALMEYMKSKIERGLTPTQLQVLYPNGLTDADLESLANLEIQNRSVEQRARAQEKRTTTREKALTVANESVDQKQTAFLQSFSGNSVNPIVKSAANYFAQNVYMSGTTAGAITQAISEYMQKNPDKPDYAELVNYVDGQLQNSGQQVMDLRQARVLLSDNYQDSQGMFRQETLDESLSGEEAAIGSFSQQVNNEIDALISLDASEFKSGQDMVAAGQAILSQITNTRNASAAELVAREQNLLDWKTPGTRAIDADYFRQWGALSQPLDALEVKLEQFMQMAQARVEQEAQAEIDKMAFAGDDKTAMNNMLAGAEIGEVIEVNGELYTVVAESDPRRSRNSGGKRLRPVPGPTRREALDYLANGQTGDIITHNGVEYEIVNNTGRSSRTQPTKLVRR